MIFEGDVWKAIIEISKDIKRIADTLERNQLKKMTDEEFDSMLARLLADRKTEPNGSEKPNNSTISKMEQVDKDTNVRSKDCETCKFYHPDHEAIACERCLGGKYSNYEPKDEQSCDTCKHKDCCESATYEYKNYDWMCLGYSPLEDEPQKCYLRKSCDHYGDKQVCGRCREYNLYSHTKTESQTKMSLDDAYYLVYKDLTRMDGVLTGKYDAKNGYQQYMNGVWSVMELIAYGVGIDCYHAFNERYSKNMVESMERAEGSE